MLQLYKNIKKLRLENGWTQTELAQRAGYADKGMISRIENGKVDLQQSQILKFAKIFNVSPSELMGNDGIASVSVGEWYGMTSSQAPEEQPYYLNDDARELAQFLFDNPEYKVLFDASRKVKREDLEFVKQMIDKITQ